MEGVAGIQPVAAHTVVFQPVHRLLQILRGPGQHGVGTVVGGHRQTGELVGQALHPLGGGEDRGHPAAGGQAAEQAAALGQQQGAVFEAEYTGDAGRRVLADAVADHHVWFEAPRLPEPGQAHLDREQGRLGVAGLPDGGFAFWTLRVKNDVQQWPFEHVGDRRRAPVHCLGEYRLGLEQLPGHAGGLAALTWEQPRGPRLVGAIPPHQTRRRAILGQRTQCLTRGLDRIHHQGGPVLEVRPPHSGGKAHVGERGFRVGSQPVAVSLRELHQGFRAARR